MTDGPRGSTFLYARAFAAGVILLAVWAVATGPLGGRPKFTNAHAADEASSWLAAHASDSGYWLFGSEALGQVAGFAVVGGLVWLIFDRARSTLWAAVALAGGVQFLVLGACAYAVGQYGPLFSSVPGGVLADGTGYLYGQGEMLVLLVYAQAGLGMSVIAAARGLWCGQLIGRRFSGIGVVVGATGIAPFVFGANLHLMQAVFVLTNLARFVWLIALAVLALRGRFDQGGAARVAASTR